MLLQKTAKSKHFVIQVFKKTGVGTGVGASLGFDPAIWRNRRTNFLFTFFNDIDTLSTINARSALYHSFYSNQAIRQFGGFG